MKAKNAPTAEAMGASRIAEPYRLVQHPGMIRWVAGAVLAGAGLVAGLLSGYQIAAEHARAGHLPCDC